MNTYKNPILRGFYPDPAIVRVENDYYMVNSSFQYFPAIPIHHSTDLVHWELIGHGITENKYLDLSDISDSHGIWACDISYHNGEFYIFATLRLNDIPENTTGRLRQILVVKSKSPAGPYSKPVVLDIDSIDSSHFVDDDGSHYCITAPGITITKLNEDCTKIIEPTKNVWPGTGVRCSEGPHILKKDDWYYAILAEGGTGYGHQINIGRSKELYGEYESCPYNPIMTQHDPNAPIQRCGHGKLVETQNGEWWIPYLCGRPNGGNFTTVGRETALDKVTWTDDGWFVVNDLKGPTLENTAPNLPQTLYESITFDDFDNETLSKEWEFVRNPRWNNISLTENKGFLTLYAGEYDLCERSSYNTMVRRETELSYTAKTKFKFIPKAQGQQAGVTCYYGINNYIKCYVTLEDTHKIILEENRNGIKTIIGELSIPEYNSEIYLKVITKNQQREFFYSLDDNNFTKIGIVTDCTFLSDEGVTIGKHHTGTLVGIFAYNGDKNLNKEKAKVMFDYFDYTA